MSKEPIKIETDLGKIIKEDRSWYEIYNELKDRIRYRDGRVQWMLIANIRMQNLEKKISELLSSDSLSTLYPTLETLIQINFPRTFSTYSNLPVRILDYIENNLESCSDKLLKDVIVEAVKYIYKES